MKIAVFASLLASAAAFAPAKQSIITSSLSMSAFEDELGAQAPLGFFDPFGQLSGEDQDRFDRLRYVEIKHGRIAMLAFLGQITTRAGIHLPGNINYAGDSFDSFPNGLAAIFGPDAIPTAGLVQIIAFIGVLECAFMKSVPGTGNEFVGDFRNGYIDFGWDTFDEETKLQKRAIELNNGRAAQFGILGLMVHEKIIPLGYDPDLPIIGHLV
jgi:Chlorophyll A-B binding protein